MNIARFLCDCWTSCCLCVKRMVLEIPLTNEWSQSRLSTEHWVIIRLIARVDAHHQWPRGPRLQHFSLEQDHSDLRPGESGYGFGSVWLPKFNRTSLSKVTFSGKIFMEIWLVFPETWANLLKNALSRNVEHSLKKSWIQIWKRMASKI